MKWTDAIPKAYLKEFEEIRKMIHDGSSSLSKRSLAITIKAELESLGIPSPSSSTIREWLAIKH